MQNAWMNVAFILLALAPASMHGGAANGPLYATAENQLAVGGIVISVDVVTSRLVIRPSSLLGVMRIEARAYRVRQPIGLIGLKPGDRVSAIYSAKDDMLHRVRRVTSAKAVSSRLAPFVGP
jgi:hypothetical protein